MMLGSFFFKHKARQALKGNWQTALLVTFFSGIFLTVAQVAQSVTMQDINPLMSSLSMTLGSMPEGITPESAHYHEVLDLYRRLYAAITSVPQSTWMMLLGGNLLALVVSPVLNVSLSHYFIRRIDGEDIGFAAGLTARLNLFFRSLWLYVIMAVKIFLWSLLFIIPGIIAALRYSMAAFYLAEDPSLTARQAIRKSKDSMQHMKMSYFMLQLSFIGWNLLISLVQMFLLDVNPVIALVVAQFLSLAVSTYMNASCAVFYCAVSRPGGMEGLVRDARSHFHEMGMDESPFDEIEENMNDQSNNGDDDR